MLLANMKYCMYCIPVWIGTWALTLLIDAGDKEGSKSNSKRKRYRVVNILVYSRTTVSIGKQKFVIKYYQNL